MKNEKDEFYLESILESIGYVQSFTKGVAKSRFTSDLLIQSATLKQLENIGEAAKNLGDNTKKENPAIPWGDIIGTRNILIHNYLKVDLDKIWNTVTTDLPILKSGIKKILK